MSKKYDSLGDRMKGYENIARNYLTRRIPTIIRVDGKAFHTFTRGMEKPFDRILMTTMQNTMKYLCENIQGCVFGYTQSDEITLVLTDYATITTDAWFGYNIQKMCSVSASMATLAFSNAYAAELWKNFPEAMCSSQLVMQISVKKNSTARAATLSKICCGKNVASIGMTSPLIVSVVLLATKQKLKRPLLFSTIKATPKWLRSLETVGLSTESLPFSHKKEGTLKNGYDTG